MKKVIRILLITVGAILLLLILLPLVFRSKIEETVKQKINESVYATVDWSRFSLSLFHGFPDLSINLRGMSVVGLGDFDGDTLAGLERFELRVNPFGAFGGEIVVSTILLDRPLINGIVLKDGSANWDITVEPEKKDTAGPGQDDMPAAAESGEGGEGSGSSMGVSLKRLTIKGARIHYHDETLGAEASMEGLNLALAGDFSASETDMELKLAIEQVNATYGGIRYMRDGSIGLDLTAGANMVENIYTIRDNEIRINGLVLGIEGTVHMLDVGGMDLDLGFFTRETSFQTLLSMVPAIYLQDFESLSTSGNLALEGSVKGTMKDSILPDATLILEVSDGYFAYPDLPKDVSDVQIRLEASYNGEDMDQSTVDLEQFHLLLGGNPFDVKLHVDHPVSDMHVAGSMKGLVDFSTLKDVVPLEDVKLDGRLTADLDLDTRISFIEQERYEEVDLVGLLLIEGVELEAPDIPVPVSLQKMEMNFNPRLVELAGLDLTMGGSDLHVEGSLSNFIPYVFTDATVSGMLHVASERLDINELMPDEEPDSDSRVQAGSETDEPIVEPVPPDSLAEPASTRIPENISFDLGLDLKEVIYDNILVENIKGEMSVHDGVAGLKGLEMDVIDGHVTAEGEVNTRGEYASADLALDMHSVDIPSSYAAFVTVERLAPMARYCRGSANVKLKYRSLLDASFTPLYESIDADGRIFTRDVQIYNLKSFVRLSELLKNERFRDMAPDNMDIRFRVREGRVMVDPFDVDFDDSRITVSGSHGIDMTMDYLLDMNIAKSDLGEGANALMQGVTALASGAGFKVPESDHVNVKAKITGTFNEPRVSTDLSGNLQSGREAVTEVVEERVKEEVEKVEQQVREEAVQKADEILKEAEAEAERIMEEARKAGEELKKEAERQGEKLVKEAGSNPIKKIAAQEASKELVRQAEKQSEKLLMEAQIKADAIIEEAGKRADQI